MGVVLWHRAENALSWLPGICTEKTLRVRLRTNCVRTTAGLWLGTKERPCVRGCKCRLEIGNSGQQLPPL